MEEAAHDSPHTLRMNSQYQKPALSTVSQLLSPSGEKSFVPSVHTQALMVRDGLSDRNEGDIKVADIFARSVNEARRLVRLIQCPLCSRPFTQPVTLPCGHTVCRTCLPEPKPRTNISYPNTPDHLAGVACPLLHCHAEHAAAECSVDVSLTKLMELMRNEITQHVQSSKTRLLLEEVPRQNEDSHIHYGNLEEGGVEEDVQEKDMGEKDAGEKDASEEMPHSRVLHGGRLASTFYMMELGELRYSSDLAYKPVSESSDDFSEDMKLVQRLRDIVQKELECHVCYTMMIEPTTPGCGHTFCRRCLQRVMDHGNICPVCRRRLHLPPSLEGKGSNILLNSLMQELCPDLVAARKKAAEAEEQVGEGGLEIPLFICTLSLPNMPTFLYIFEPRYRLMMRRCMAHNRRFGMVMYNKTLTPQGHLGPAPFLEYGTILEIINYELLPDGRSYVETRGISRFKVRSHGMLDGYHVARVVDIEDVSLAEEATIEQQEVGAAQTLVHETRARNPDASVPTLAILNMHSTQQLLDNCMAFVRHMRHQSAPWLNTRIVQVYGEPPDDPATFPYWLASVLPIAEMEKYTLLRVRSVRERMKLSYSWISRIQGQAWATGSACTIL